MVAQLLANAGRQMAQVVDDAILHDHADDYAHGGHGDGDGDERPRLKQADLKAPARPAYDDSWHEHASIFLAAGSPAAVAAARGVRLPVPPTQLLVYHNLRRRLRAYAQRNWARWKKCCDFLQQHQEQLKRRGTLQQQGC